MTDPAVQAVAEDLFEEAHEHEDGWGGGLLFWDAVAQVAVDAHRSHVLTNHPDAERIERLRRMSARPGGGLDKTGVSFERTWSTEVRWLLAALADETAARQQAEADRDLLVRVRDEAVGKTADYAEVIRRVRDRLDALAEGELAHRSRDYGRGVAQAVREIRAVLDGAADPAVDEETRRD